MAWKQLIPNDMDHLSLLQRMMMRELLMSAKRVDCTEVVWHGRKRYIINLQSGQCILKLSDWERELNLSRYRLKKLLLDLSNFYTPLEVKQYPFGVVVTIKNYDELCSFSQRTSNEPPTNLQRTSSELTANSQRTFSELTANSQRTHSLLNNKIDKSEKREKNEKSEKANSSLSKILSFDAGKAEAKENSPPELGLEMACQIVGISNFLPTAKGLTKFCEYYGFNLPLDRAKIEVKKFKKADYYQRKTMLINLAISQKSTFAKLGDQELSVYKSKDQQEVERLLDREIKGLNIAAIPKDMAFACSKESFLKFVNFVNKNLKLRNKPEFLPLDSDFKNFQIRVLTFGEKVFKEAAKKVFGVLKHENEFWDEMSPSFFLARDENIRNAYSELKITDTKSKRKERRYILT